MDTIAGVVIHMLLTKPRLCHLTELNKKHMDKCGKVVEKK
jgi:hypothetical protein